MVIFSAGFDVILTAFLKWQKKSLKFCKLQRFRLNPCSTQVQQIIKIQRMNCRYEYNEFIKKVQPVD